MQSSLIGKIEKARRYAEEKGRIDFQNFAVKFRGDHNSYVVSFEGGAWHCSCDFFGKWGTCSHTMAMRRVLGDMLSVEETDSVARAIPQVV